jgi:hypothetical protein
MKDKLIDIGFKYNDILDEWSKPTFEGYIIIWKTPNSSKWRISYEDLDDYLHTVFEGYDYEVITTLKSFERDKKLEELLNS